MYTMYLMQKFPINFFLVIIRKQKFPYLIMSRFLKRIPKRLILFLTLFLYILQDQINSKLLRKPGIFLSLIYLRLFKPQTIISLKTSIEHKLKNSYSFAIRFKMPTSNQDISSNLQVYIYYNR